MSGIVYTYVPGMTNTGGGAGIRKAGGGGKIPTFTLTAALPAKGTNMNTSKVIPVNKQIDFGILITRLLKNTLPSLYTHAFCMSNIVCALR